MHTYIAFILHIFHTIVIVLFKACKYHNKLVKDLNVQQNKLEGMSVINFDV